jgi:hypothetical protein
MQVSVDIQRYREDGHFLGARLHSPGSVSLILRGAHICCGKLPLRHALPLVHDEPLLLVRMEDLREPVSTKP